jgi:Ca-activated chloride channel family protein
VADDEESLSRRYHAFLEEVELLISEEERTAFLSLSKDYQRQAFIERFWQVRDPYPETARNEFRDRFMANVEAARQRFDDLSQEPARMMLLHGEPRESFEVRCSALRRLDLWFYSGSGLVRGEFALVFVEQGATYRLWSPRSSVGSLVLFATGIQTPQQLAQLVDRECTRSDRILMALSMALDMEELERRAGSLVPEVHPEWAQSFVSYSTDLPPDAEPLPASFQMDFPGRHQSRTVVQAALGVQPDAAQPGQIGEHRSWSFLVDGEVLLRDELFESFRYRFDIPTESRPETGPIPLVIQRYLRPGTYTFIVKLQDLNSERFFRRVADIQVPNVRLGKPAEIAAPELVAERPPEQLELLEVLAEANATLASSAPEESEEHSLRLEAPSDRLLTGKVRLLARATGEGIERVRFALDDQPVLAKRRSPYSVELDLGRAPLAHTVRASALDADGRVLASDEIVLNTGPHRFAIRLVEPERGRRYRHSVRAVAEVEVPELEKLDRVELYLNETLVATLFQPPFVQPIVIPPDQPLAYVRALGILEGGAYAEDVVFVNSPNPIDEVEVDFVELYATVLDGKGRPAEGLAAADFTVREDDIEQSIRRFEMVRDLPIHAGILLDTSTSMTQRLREAEEAAMHFFQIVLTPKDRVCLMTFNDQPHLQVRFTNSVEVLAGGLAGLVAESETALHDSLIFALYYFSGIKGKRALVLLSDGEDSSSEYSFEEAIEFARRTGVAIYAIGLSIATKEVEIRTKLQRLCRETGGSCFFIERAGELKSVYTQIEEELRSQYLIAYQSSQPGPEDRFREVELEVHRPGLRAKTMRGYYP